MKIAACQVPHIHRDIDRALSLIDVHTSDAERQGVKLICFPECFLQGYEVSTEHVVDVALDLESTEFERIRKRLEGCEPVIVLGLVEKEGSKFYNTAVVIHRGRLVTRYRKTHLTEGEQEMFEAGSDYPVFDVSGTKVGINICYDLCFAESLESALRAGAKLLACPCNNMLRPSNAEAWKDRHNQIRCERAREARVWMMSSDVTGEHGGRIAYGPTAVIDSDGRVVAQVPVMTTGMVVFDFPG